MNLINLDENTTSVGSIISISDLHFYPFYEEQNEALNKGLIQSEYTVWDEIYKKYGNNQVSTYGSETNYTLLDSTINHMKLQCSDPDFIVFAGDFLSHHFNTSFDSEFEKIIQTYTVDEDIKARDAFVIKTINYITDKISKAFPAVPVYFTLGNNDSYSGDYMIQPPPKGAFLTDTADLFFRNCIMNEGNRASFYATYPNGGYYSIVPPCSKKGRIIGLNSIYFSSSYQNQVGGIQNAAGDSQLQWLEAQLSMAEQNSEKVWMILHIPIGSDVFGTVKKDMTNKQIKSEELEWNTGYLSQFLSITNKYAQSIEVSFSGHTHVDDFRLVFDKENTEEALAFTHITPSITPVFGNNPGFQVFTYDREAFTLKDYTTYYIDLKAVAPSAELVWKNEYSFNEEYAQTEVSAAARAVVLKGIMESSATREKYLNNYGVSAVETGVSENWLAYWCGIFNMTIEDYVNCYNQHEGTGDTSAF